MPASVSPSSPSADIIREPEAVPLPCRSLHGLPEMAGLGSLERMARPGPGVNACVDRLKRWHYFWLRTWQVLLSRLAAEPVYELKMAWSHHAYLAAEHVAALRGRVAEMRHPPLGLDQVPHAGLELFFDELRAAPVAADVLEGLYGIGLPALTGGMEAHLAETNPLADAPTCRVLRIILAETGDLLAWGRAALDSAYPEVRPGQGGAAWHTMLRQCLAAAGGVNGGAPGQEPVPVPHFSAVEWKYDGTPQRDERFPDPYNMGVHAESFLYDPQYPAVAKTLMMYYKRLREIDVPEMMASILTEIEGRPWDFYRDLTRQLWDEARHAMMGEAGFTARGIDWGKFVMVNSTWSRGLNEQLSPQERHAVLWFIEQGLMTKTGKRFEWETGVESGDALAEVFQDFDWADEVLHARIGRDWYVRDFEGDTHRAADYGSACWSKVVSGWEDFRAQGLTRHRNWWPELYREFCRLRGEPPDPAVLAFDTSYQESRADLQRISASG